MPQSYPLKCRIQAAAGKSDVTRVDIYDDIGAGDGFFGPQGVSAQDFVNTIGDIKGDLEVHINSAGGDVFQGIAISNAISGHNGVVTTIVDGLAASIASVIAQAGRHRIMSSGAMMMIHDAFGGCMGNESDMRDMAKTLAKVSDNLADIYAKRSRKGTTESWRAEMKKETWYTAEEAVVAGLADTLGETAAVMPQGLNTAMFAGAPDRIMARLVTLESNRPKAKALAVHHTATSDKPWDGGKAKKGFPNKESVLNYCNAWFDSSATGEGAADTKGNYKFPHHYTNGGPAILPGVRNALARLAGAKIPDSDRAGVEAHLRAHLKDAGSDEADNALDYFINRYGPGAHRLAIMDKLPTLEADGSKWKPTKAIKNAIKSDDPESFFRAICAGRRYGDPTQASAWALPYRYSPTAKPNVEAIMDALAAIAITPGLTNAEQAKEFLTELMSKIDPGFSAEKVDSRLLTAALLSGLKGA